MESMKSIMIGCLLAFVATVAYADKYDDLYKKCMASYSSINNSAVYDCGGSVEQQMQVYITVILGKVYEARSGDESGTQAISEAHQKWADYMEAECVSQSSNIGSPMITICSMEKMQARIIELQMYLMAYE